MLSVRRTRIGPTQHAPCAGIKKGKGDITKKGGDNGIENEQDEPTSPVAGKKRRMLAPIDLRLINRRDKPKKEGRKGRSQD